MNPVTYSVHHNLECLGSDNDGDDDDFILFYLVQPLNRHVPEIIRQPIQIHTIRNRTMLVVQLGSVLVFVFFSDWSVCLCLC